MNIFFRVQIFRIFNLLIYVHALDQWVIITDYAQTTFLRVCEWSLTKFRSYYSKFYKANKRFFGHGAINPFVPNVPFLHRLKTSDVLGTVHWGQMG